MLAKAKLIISCKYSLEFQKLRTNWKPEKGYFLFADGGRVKRYFSESWAVNKQQFASILFIVVSEWGFGRKKRGVRYHDLADAVVSVVPGIPKSKDLVVLLCSQRPLIRALHTKTRDVRRFYYTRSLLNMYPVKKRRVSVRRGVA